MDTLTLREMDQRADRTIATWSFAGLAANLLPPPFDVMAVSAVFARMGMRLADIYEIETTWATVRTLGAAVATGGGAVLGAFYVATSWATWVPGINRDILVSLHSTTRLVYFTDQRSSTNFGKPCVCSFR